VIGTALHALAARVGVGLILYAFSELIFVNEAPAAALLGLIDGSGSPGPVLMMIAWYSGFASIFLAALRWRGPHGLTGLMLAAMLGGWVIEALLVPVVYEGPPVSFLWPSIGWHALIDIGVGWFALRLALRHLALPLLLIVLSVAGIAWGIWSTWVLTGPEAAAAAIPAAGFPAYAAVVAGLWIGGTILSDLAPPSPRAGRAELVLAALASAGLFVLTGLAFWPWALVLAACVALVLAALRCAPNWGAGLLARLDYRPQPWRYLALPVMPVAAMFTYLWMIETGRTVSVMAVAGSLMILGALASAAALTACAIAAARKCRRL
jgi:hypothetical protein